MPWSPVHVPPVHNLNVCESHVALLFVITVRYDTASPYFITLLIQSPWHANQTCDEARRSRGILSPMQGGRGGTEGVPRRLTNISLDTHNLRRKPSAFFISFQFVITNSSFSSHNVEFQPATWKLALVATLWLWKWTTVLVITWFVWCVRPSSAGSVSRKLVTFII